MGAIVYIEPTLAVLFTTMTIANDQGETEGVIIPALSILSISSRTISLWRGGSLSAGYVIGDGSLNSNECFVGTTVALSLQVTSPPCPSSVWYNAAIAKR